MQESRNLEGLNKLSMVSKTRRDRDKEADFLTPRLRTLYFLPAQRCRESWAKICAPTLAQLASISLSASQGLLTRTKQAGITGAAKSKAMGRKSS